MKNGNSLRVVVESVSSDGKGIARMPNGKVLFVAGGLPEEGRADRHAAEGSALSRAFRVGAGGRLRGHGGQHD